MSLKGRGFGPTAEWRRKNEWRWKRKQLDEQELRRRQRIAEQSLPPEIRQMRDDMLVTTGDSEK